MRGYIAVGSMVLASACGGAVAPVATGPSGLPLAKLASAGVQLTAATSTPSITQAQAEAHYKGRVVDVAFRHVTDSHRQPTLSLDAWVVVLDPKEDHSAAGPPGSSPAPASFSVAILDGHTGGLIEAVSGS